jgi:iron complex transport system substrate-binding protein
MRQWINWITAVAGCLICLNAWSVTVVDDRGVSVTFDRPVQRIVSLLPSLTESICALGQCGLLVGVDNYSDYPQSVQRLPHVGGGLDPSIESIVILRPDVVVLATSSRIAQRIQSLGIKVIAMEPRSLVDVQRVMLRLGDMLGVSDAAKVWQTIDSGVSDAAQLLPASAKGLRVYFEVNQGPYAASQGSFIGEILMRLGMNNIVPASLGPFPKLNPEFVVQANPDFIMVGQQGEEGIVQRPGWSKIRAIRQQRVCIFSPEQGNVLVRAGPRMAEAARLMAACISQKMQTSTESHL